MSTEYFVLSKSINDIIDNKNDRIMTFTANNYILPKNLIQCYISNGLFEKTLIDWSKQYCNPNSVFLDIGAHTGTYSISLAKYCKQVYSFEPQEMTFYALCGSVALSGIRNIKCINAGLGAPGQVGPQTLKIISPDGGGSTLHASTITKVLAEEEIQIKTLDDYGITNVSFIKMDVEGNELQVLQGAVKTLTANGLPTIIFEENVKNIALEKFLTELGYKILPITNYPNMFLAKGATPP